MALALLCGKKDVKRLQNIFLEKLALPPPLVDTLLSTCSVLSEPKCKVDRKSPVVVRDIYF
jgi:hypothetical protein